MIDPEVEHRRLVSGDAPAIRSAVETLRAEARSLDDVRQDIDHAATVPIWKGRAAFAFNLRAGSLVRGVATTWAMVNRAAGALDAAASAYDDVVGAADFYISFWRNRPSWLPEIVAELLARQVNARLLDAGKDYDEALRAIAAVLTGDEVDTDELDDDLRAWVEQGMEKNEEWLDDTGSDLGPMIPNIAATGDDRGWIPQGSAYDPGTRSLLQAYYNSGDYSSLAVVDEVTGREVTEVRLGDTLTVGGSRLDVARPGHVGGVAVDGDHVYVTDSGYVYQYSMSELRGAMPGATVNPTAVPQPVDAGSYATVKDGVLYVGNFAGDTMQRYEKVGGTWTELGGPIPTPDNTQGVLVRDGEYVFSTSYGRHAGSALVVEDRETGDRSDPYAVPNMSQSVFEVDGDIVVTYESGAEKFSESATGNWGWFWGVPDEDGLWANPYWTRTPLDELGLEEDLEVEPATLTRAARDLQSSEGTLSGARSSLAGVRVPAHVLGRVPAAAVLSRAVDSLVDEVTSSLRTGSRAVGLSADKLTQAAEVYVATDQGTQQRFRGLMPW